MRLNLGAGKIIFPMSDETLAGMHPLTPIPATRTEPDWVNVDHFAMPGIDKVMDLFVYPWPLEDNCADEIWCSHIIEHIPHETRQALISPLDTSAQGRWATLRNLDGFFAFFAECYRVLKPGGKLTVYTPYAFSTEAFQDPTHTRYIVPQTFHYLTEGSDSSHYNYHLPFAFTGANLSAQFNPEFAHMDTSDAFSHAVSGMNVIRQLSIELYPVK